MLKLRFDRYISNLLPGKDGEGEKRLSKVRYLVSSLITILFSSTILYYFVKSSCL